MQEPYTGRAFPGYENINLAFDELENLVRKGLPDWKAPLESVKGIYLITDTSTGRRYVGAAYGDQGIWGRWNEYINSGHGGNAELRTLVTDPNLDYCRKNFRFALLEHHSALTNRDIILAREAFWKEVLLSRGQQGLNRK